MQLSDFEYELPPELIAQYPPADRTSARLLQLDSGNVTHGNFTDVLHLLQAGDVLVLNNTRVIKARLHGVKDSGGQAEILLERLLDEHRALCQVRVSKPLKEGRVVRVGDARLSCVGRQGQFYELESDIPLLELMEVAGHVPLPPYIERADESTDGERYQTVFGRIPGAVAAPTAGLHFSDELLSRIRARGVAVVEVTLHVGAGTFQPVRGDIEMHEMHQEVYEVPSEAAATIENARATGGRVVAVGTTVVRTLESAVCTDREGCLKLATGQGETRLFIQPGYRFRVVDVLITNFHLPGSTLLMLVSAFAGHEAVMNAYRVAREKQYRFFSYGDAQWLVKAAGKSS